MSISSSTPTPTATPASAPSSGTYSIYAQDVGIFLEFADGNEGTNLTTWEAATNNASQQVRPPSFAVQVFMLTQLIVASHRKCFDILHISERSLRKLHLLHSAIFDRKPDTICLVYRSIQRRFLVSSFQSTVHSIYKEVHRFSPDTSYTSFWNVDNGFTDNNNPVSLLGAPVPLLINSHMIQQVILYPSGNIWIFNPIASNQSSSSKISSSTTSASEFPSSSGTSTPTTTSITHGGAGKCHSPVLLNSRCRNSRSFTK